MAVEKGLVLTAIEKKFKGKSLSKTFKESIAAKWAEKIDTDADIEEYINDREDVILEASTEADRRATDARNKALAESKKPEQKTDEKETIELPADTPDYVKVMMKKMETMGAEISGFKAQTQQKSLEERFKANPELKGIPEFMFKGRIPKTEEEFETAVQELKTDYTQFAEANKLSNIGLDTPGGGNQNSNPKSTEVPAEVKAFAEKNLKQSTN